jgi:hypothetical protein
VLVGSKRAGGTPALRNGSGAQVNGRRWDSVAVWMRKARTRSRFKNAGGNAFLRQDKALRSSGQASAIREIEARRASGQLL